MYQINNIIAYIAIIIASLSTLLTPFLKVILVGNWNLYEVDVRLFYITNILLLLLLLCAYFKQITLFKVLTRLYFVWVIISILAVYFQVNNYFGMKLADGLISKSIKFKWGWLVLISSAVLLLFSVQKSKTVIHEK